MTTTDKENMSKKGGKQASILSFFGKKSDNNNNQQQTPKHQILPSNSTNDHSPSRTAGRSVNNFTPLASQGTSTLGTNSNAVASTPHSHNRNQDLITKTPSQEHHVERDQASSVPRNHNRKRPIIVSDDDGDDDNDDQETPLKKIHAFSATTPAGTTPKQLKTTPSSSSTFKTPKSSSAPKTRSEKFREKNDERYKWLDEPKDNEKRSKSDPDYDPRTLYIPSSAKAKFTEFEKQYWEIKSQHFDTVVFFKKGKFYELFEMDADIGHQHFDLKLTDRVNMRMVGVPEASFEHWAAQFVAKGFKVARVDQMENSFGKAIREKKGPKEKVLRRELTSILTKGTLVDSKMLTSDLSTYCMSIKEDLQGPLPSYAISFVDTSTSEFNLSYFEDDQHRTQLETLLLQTNPAEIILEKGHSSQQLLKLVKNVTKAAVSNFVSGTEFWSSDTTLEELDIHDYFGKKSKKKTDDAMDIDNDVEPMQVEEQGEEEGKNWPETIKAFSKNANVMSSMGALICYLRTLKLDRDLISTGNFKTYDAVRESGTLILDGQTLLNLEVFENVEGSEEGTLFSLLNQCVTPFGKRLFKQWVCHPLRNIESINERLDAVDDLMEFEHIREDIKRSLTKLPDLERHISRIHAGNCKVREFVNVLDAFKQIKHLFGKLEGYTEELKQSSLLKQVFSAPFPPELSELLSFFRDAFDHDDAITGENILVREGFDASFDEATKSVLQIEQEFDSLRKRLQKEIGQKINYKDMGKELYQLEVGSKVKVPKNWTQMSKTQQVCRYWTPESKELVQSFNEAKEIRDEALRNVKANLYAKFDGEYSKWLGLIKLLANLDCLVSLSISSAGMNGCRPAFISDAIHGSLSVEELRHPCITGKEFIPNDTKLGGNDNNGNTILLTGPNMSGKSTLLRSNCIAVILAQLGCYVPATSAELTPFDRIFTRIGANDNILAGKSTFMVELSETCKILREATPKSLVILDELGRGTSTFDGYAIAYSVLFYLVTTIRCCTLFSTHYHMLTEEFKSSPLIKLMFMMFICDEDKRDITFLYKLTPGVCSKSFGMVVANLAGVPVEIIDGADLAAMEFEKSQKWQQNSDSNIKSSNLTKLATFKSIMDLDTEKGEESLKALSLSLQTTTETV